MVHVSHPTVFSHANVLKPASCAARPPLLQGSAWAAGCPRASMHGFDCPVVSDGAIYSGTCHLRSDVVFVAEPTVNKPVERFLTERPMLPRGLADHVATVKIGGARIGERLRLVGSRFDMYCVGERFKHVVSPSPDISFMIRFHLSTLVKNCDRIIVLIHE